MPSTLQNPGYVDGHSLPFMSDAHQQFYAEQGFLVIENALNSQEIDGLNRETLQICRGNRGTYDGWQGPHDGQTDEQVLAQYLCVHFPHKLSSIMADALAHPAIVETLTRVISPDVKCMQSMLFIKGAGKPGQAWHQDEDYIPTRDRSLCGGWIALDDATTENGCLWVIPGSHKHGVLWPQEEQNDTTQFDCSQISVGFPYTEKDAVPVEVKAGSIVFFNGYLLHRSLPNRATSGYRRVLVNHYMSAASLLPWTAVGNPDHDTFLDDHPSRSIAKCDCRDITLIAGTDPYAWMGTRDISKPYVRPSGEGGCAKSPGQDDTA